MGRTAPLYTALGSLVRALEEIEAPYMIIGGIAVVVRGHPRYTRDIDASVDLPPGRIPLLMKALGNSWKPAVKSPLRFATDHGVLPLRGPDRMTADLVLPMHPLELDAIARATVEEIRGLEVRVCTLEDLLLLKIGAHRTQDLEDIRALLAIPGRRIPWKRLEERVRTLSRDLADEDVFELWSVLFAGGRSRRRRTPR